MMNRPLRTVPTEWREVILVCGKCSKKIGGGFGAKGDQRLDKALRKELGLGKGRKAGIKFIRVPCFDICPKGAVTVSKAGEPDRLFLVPRGAPVEDVADALGIAPLADGSRPE